MGLFGRRPPEPDNISLANSKFFKSEPDELPEFYDKDHVPDEEPTPVIKPDEPPAVQEVQQEKPVISEPVRPSADERTLIDRIDTIVMAMKEIGHMREQLSQQLSAKESSINAILLQLDTEQTEKEEITSRLAETEIEWTRLKAELKRLSD